MRNPATTSAIYPFHHHDDNIYNVVSDGSYTTPTPTSTQTPTPSPSSPVVVVHRQQCTAASTIGLLSKWLKPCLAISISIPLSLSFLLSILNFNSHRFLCPFSTTTSTTTTTFPTVLSPTAEQRHQRIVDVHGCTSSSSCPTIQYVTFTSSQ